MFTAAPAFKEPLATAVGEPPEVCAQPPDRNERPENIAAHAAHEKAARGRLYRSTGPRGGLAPSCLIAAVAGDFFRLRPGLAFLLRQRLDIQQHLGSLDALLVGLQVDVYRQAATVRETAEQQFVGQGTTDRVLDQP